LEIEVVNAPFLVNKLNIKVLPCVIGFVNGNEQVRLLGFEKLGNSDNFTPEQLEFQLFEAGLLLHRSNNLSTKFSGISTNQKSSIRRDNINSGDSDEEFYD